MGKKRSRMEIFHDILLVISRFNKVGPTKIIYKANLSHKRFKEYISLLEEEGLIEKISIKKHTHFKLTEKGHQFLKRFNQVKELSDAFGLPL